MMVLPTATSNNLASIDDMSIHEKGGRGFKILTTVTLTNTHNALQHT